MTHQNLPQYIYTMIDVMKSFCAIPLADIRVVVLMIYLLSQLVEAVEVVNSFNGDEMATFFVFK